jgi:hypothetical protein
MGKYLKTKSSEKKRITQRKHKTRKNNTRKNNTKKNKTKKNKTRKNKISGGGKLEKEIIDELKSKGKYEEWVSLGSYFGLTSNTLNIPEFKIRPYKYYNVDGKIVDVSMIGPNYRPDLDNIAVFQQIYEEDPSHVEQGKYKIVNSNEPLTTTGLATCTGLAMIIGDKKFMTHLDATTPISDMINKITQVISEQQVNPEDLEPHIFTGSLNADLTLKKAKEICSAVGIPSKNFIISSVCMIDIVEAPTKNISNKRQLDDEYEEPQNGVKFAKYNEYHDDGDDYVYKADEGYNEDYDDDDGYYRG